MGTDWYQLPSGRCGKTDTNLLPMIKLNETVLNGKDARTQKSEQLSGQQYRSFYTLSSLMGGED